MKNEKYKIDDKAEIIGAPSYVSLDEAKGYGLTIGLIGSIKNIDENDKEVVIDDGKGSSLWFPFDSVKLVTNKPNPTKPSKYQKLLTANLEQNKKITRAIEIDEKLKANNKESKELRAELRELDL